MIVWMGTRWWLPGALALVVAALGATTAASAPRHAEPATVGAWLRTPARSLAAIDCLCTPGPARVARYRALLVRLAARCQESQGRLAYISKTATEILRQNGRRRTNRWLLTELDRRVPRHVAQQQPCRYVVALFVPVH